MGKNCSAVSFDLGDTAIQLYEFNSQSPCIKGNNMLRLAVRYHGRTLQHRHTTSTTQQCNSNEAIYGVLMDTASSQLVESKSH